MWKDVLSQTAKDINSIYSSYNLVQHQYVETVENESYSTVKKKWLVLQSQRQYQHIEVQVTGASAKRVGLTTETA